MRQLNKPHNKGMQSDLQKRYAFSLTADAGRYKALVGDQVKEQLDVIANLQERKYESLAN